MADYDVGTLGEFDLNPDPRLLQMLGEIDLEPWRCVAELVDNSVDGFLHAKRGGAAVDGAEVNISLPSKTSSDAKVVVFDTGPGMDGPTLERAVRAGYSGNNPIDSLGLFGMGFNIATARLGATTTVWSTRAGDDVVHGVKIDFADLRARQSFRTPHLVQSKSNHDAHFTRIEISNLKVDKREFLATPSNQRTLRNMLARSYGAMLRANGDPIHFTLRVNDVAIDGQRHCVWDEERAVEVPGLGAVRAFRPFDHRLAVDSVICTHCLASMLSTDVEAGACLSCGRTDTLEVRERRIRGWIGLQRYLHGSEFGIDFLRNGRKIEIANKDLFVWSHEGSNETEYPIDDPRNRGRFVGEVHIDHCPVDYSKQRFAREHRSWGEMVAFLRGDGPLRPKIAEELKFAPNDSILATHFKAFRRTSPASSQAGGWGRILVVPKNEIASDMAKRFQKGEPEYQSDEKWYELIKEEDEKKLYGDGKTKGSDQSGGDHASDDVVADVFGDPTVGSGTSEAASPEPQAPAAPLRDRVASLSRTYDLPKPLNMTFDVEAFRVKTDDAAVDTKTPWRLMRVDAKSKQWLFLFQPEHDVFASMTLSASDALLNELATQIADTTRGTAKDTSFAAALAQLRKLYAEQESLNPGTIAAMAAKTIDDVVNAILDRIPAEQRGELFNDLPEDERARVATGIVYRGGAPTALENGSFLRHFPEQLLGLIDKRPELFFDGALWDTEYEGLDLKDPQATLQAQRGVRDRLRSVISDAIWARTINQHDQVPGRDEMIRAVAALRMLIPDHSGE